LWDVLSNHRFSGTSLFAAEAYPRLTRKEKHRIIIKPQVLLRSHPPVPTSTNEANTRRGCTRLLRSMVAVEVTHGRHWLGI
jgi:hypothetical protein